MELLVLTDEVLVPPARRVLLCDPIGTKLELFSACIFFENEIKLLFQYIK